MSTELATREQTASLTAAEIRAQVNLIQQVMRAVMVDGTHYGKIPGCGDKPALFKPGAEKLLSTFKIAVEPIVEDLSTGDERRYRVSARCTSMSDGRFLGAGTGEASSTEEKYHWRRAVCKGEFDATPEDRRREKWNRDGSRVQQVRTAPADVANTVLKMAKKRAQVDATLTVTAASDCFAQDIEDLPEELRDDAPPPPIKPPKEKAAPPKAEAPPDGAPAEGELLPKEGSAPRDPAAPHIQGVISKLSANPGSKGGKAFTRYGVCLATDDGEVWVNHFSSTLQEEAQAMRGKMVIAWTETTDKGYTNLAGLDLA